MCIPPSGRSSPAFGLRQTGRSPCRLGKTNSRNMLEDPGVAHWWTLMLDTEFGQPSWRKDVLVFSTTCDRWACCLLQRESFEISNSKTPKLQLNPMYLGSRSCRSNWWLNLHHFDPFCMETMVILDDSAHHNMPPAGNFCRPPVGKIFHAHVSSDVRTPNEWKLDKPEERQF